MTPQTSSVLALRPVKAQYTLRKLRLSFRRQSILSSLAASGNPSMHYRTVLMYTEIGCFVACVCGWILICSTMPTEYWTYSEVASLVLTSSHYFSNLWKDCLSDSTGVSDCKEFPSLLALQSKCYFSIRSVMSRLAVFCWWVGTELLSFLYTCSQTKNDSDTTC